MKNWGLFLGGVVTGVILTVLIAVIYSHSSNNGLSGVTNFEKVGDVINESSVKVFQVLSDNAALVHGRDENSYSKSYWGPVYLLRNYDGKYYYDEEIVKKPAGKQFRQTGIYRYYNVEVGYKTVPIIELR